jgi:hypothetical protein
MKLGMVSASVVAGVVILGVMDGRAQQITGPTTSGLRGYEVVIKSVKVSGQRPEPAAANCPAGKKVFGGGAKFSRESQSADVPTVYSYPDKSGLGWIAEVKRREGGEAAGSLDVFAICANVP